MQPLVSLFLPSPGNSALDLWRNMAQHARNQQDKHQHKSPCIIQKERGNKHTTNVNFAQHTGTFSSLTTPKRLEGESSLLWSNDTEQVPRVREKRARRREEVREKKPERRSSTCHSCQTLLITAELCPAGWQAAFGAFHLTEVMGDEGSSSSHLKSVTIHPAVLRTSDTAGQHGPLGECASAAAKRQMAKQILNKGQLILHVSLSIRTPAVAVFVLLITSNRLRLGLKSFRIHVKMDF